MTSRTYLDEGLLSRIAAGHTFDLDRATEVIEAALRDLNRRTGLPDRIARWLKNHPGQPLPQTMFAGKPRIVLDLTRSMVGDQELNMAAVLELRNEISVAPALFLSLHSPVLDIPMRVEVPLRAVFRQGADLDGYTVYLHALMAGNGKVYQYYGITRRPWNLRFLEHVRAGSRKGASSRRLFARTLSSLITARVAQRVGAPMAGAALSGMITTLCLVGGTRAQALEAEEYLVDKYSLASKHPYGLNMIPGGEAGIRVAQRFRVRRNDIEETAARELAGTR